MSPFFSAPIILLGRSDGWVKRGGVSGNTVSSRNGFISIPPGWNFWLSITMRRGDPESGHKKARRKNWNHNLFINPPGLTPSFQSSQTSISRWYCNCCAAMAGKRPRPMQLRAHGVRQGCIPRGHSARTSVQATCTSSRMCASADLLTHKIGWWAMVDLPDGGSDLLYKV